MVMLKQKRKFYAEKVEMLSPVRKSVIEERLSASEKRALLRRIKALESTMKEFPVGSDVCRGKNERVCKVKSYSGFMCCLSLLDNPSSKFVVPFDTISEPKKDIVIDLGIIESTGSADKRISITASNTTTEGLQETMSLNIGCTSITFNQIVSIVSRSKLAGIDLVDMVSKHPDYIAVANDENNSLLGQIKSIVEESVNAEEASGIISPMLALAADELGDEDDDDDYDD